MSARLTVVFENEALYRRVKVYAAEHNLTMKDLIESALEKYIGEERDEGWFEPDWDVFDAWQADARAAARGPRHAPTDLSDIKQHLYGRPPQAGRQMFAEEQTPYDAR